MDHKRVVTELTQGKELALQLKIHLHNPTSSKELQEVLIHNILDSYHKSLSLLATRGFNPNGINIESHSHAGISITKKESQVSLSESPCNEHVDREFKDPNHKNLSAKSKGNMKKWKNKVQVREDMGVEEALDDGYNWRKYGQKGILGAKYPRGYYRCAYRQLQGCLATKQVQKFDEDPSIFNITYLGSHTCHPKCETTSQPQPKPLPSIAKLEILPPSSQNPSLRSSEYPSSSNNKLAIPIVDNTFDSPASSRSSFSHMSQPRFERNLGTMVLDSPHNDNASVAKSITRSKANIDVGISFGEMEFANNIDFDDSVFYG